MSTQFDTPIPDLDRTDERPVLDVVAYEAQKDSETLRADLARRDAELAQLHSELVAARAEEQSQRALLKERTDELGALRRTLSEHETAIRGFEHMIRVGGEQVAGLMAQLRTECDERVKMSVKLHNARCA
jgi:chromosome segregation ATPase